ncbi:hypothetical protein [Candidatus Ichthyocystis hellenicum]|uniref:hypothetical protein n=1 Tax=Candidatus Ichthyocystis hellenicum TaxID=1561003 RepID=UPI000B862D3D|nr:hypothetical protein [Candidatus Ichthyocystis hellenicum]
MTISRVSCYGCTEDYDLEFLAESSNEDEHITLASQKVNDRGSYNGSSLLSLSGKFMAPLLFLGTLKAATGAVVSNGWTQLKASICGLMYIEKCFDDAAARGENIPHVNVEDLLHYFLNKTAPSNNIGKAHPLEGLDAEKSVESLLHLNGNILATCRYAVFDLTSPMLKNMTHPERDIHGLSYFVDHIVSSMSNLTVRSFFYRASLMFSNNLPEQPVGTYYFLYLVDNVGKMRDDILRCSYSDLAIKSKLNIDVLISILTSGDVDTLKTHCPNITAYVPIDKHEADPTEFLRTSLTKIGDETTLGFNLPGMITALSVMGVLLFALYALSNLVGRGRRLPRQVNHEHAN